MPEYLTALYHYDPPWKDGGDQSALRHQSWYADLVLDDELTPELRRLQHQQHDRPLGRKLSCKST